MDEERLAREAANPATPLTTLQLLARDHPELRATIATNPSTYPALLEWLGRLGVPEVDDALRARAAQASAEVRPGAATAAAAPTEVRAEPAPAGTRPGATTPTDTPTEVRPTEPVPTDARPGAAASLDAPTEVRPTEPAPAKSGTATPFHPPVIEPAETRAAERPTIVQPEDTPTTVQPPIIPPVLPATGPPTAERTSPTPDRTPTTPRPATRPDRPAPTATSAASASATERRRRTLLGLGALVVLALVVVLVWMLTGRGGEDEAPPAATTPAADTGTGTSEPTATGSPDAVAAAQAALAGLAGSSTCTDPAADARVFTEFAVAASSGDTWGAAGADDVVRTALTDLQTSCGPAHAVQVNDALLAGAQTPPALAATLRDAPAWIEVARAAPADAQDLADFASPSGNIVCALGSDATTCTINERAFANPPECVDGPVTLVVPLGGEARVDCAAPAAQSAATLGYGTSTTSGRFACTSERDGVTCWSTLTGRGFAVARAQFSTF